MDAKQLREELQKQRQLLISEWTRDELIVSLKKTREQRGGLSLLEISDVIKSVLSEEEVTYLKNKL